MLENRAIQIEERSHNLAFVVQWRARIVEKVDPLASPWRDPRVARNERGELDGGRSEDLRCERKPLSRQKREIESRKGDPSRAVPLAFDTAGNFVEPLRGKIGDRNAKTARLFLEQGAPGKARRQAWCGLIGRKRDCLSGHKLYTPWLCGNRYCQTCGPKSFRKLFIEHSRLRPLVEELLKHKPGDHRPRVLAKLDVTVVNTGEMPTTEQVRRFNEDIRYLFREVEKQFGVSRKDYGLLWCCEFGSGNTNLHAHGVYCGPKLPQSKKRKEMSSLWARIRRSDSLLVLVEHVGKDGKKTISRTRYRSAMFRKLRALRKRLRGHPSRRIVKVLRVRGDGSKIISVKPAKNFEAALGHALKYPSKFFDADAGRLVELEIAFDRVRRVHALAAFYNPKIEREPGEEGGYDAGHCPICGDLLLDTPGYHFIDELRREDRRSVDEVRVEVGRAKVLTGAGPP